jgi:exodeoxyribonuclease V alpha subunit
MADTLFQAAIDLETIRGTISRIVYNDNGRTIARITVHPEYIRKPDGKRRPSMMSVLGSMVEPRIGQLYEFHGVPETNKYGHQLKFESYRTILPTDREGIYSYLIDTGRWVGPSHAKALIDHFGDDVLRVLREEPGRVKALSVAGLTPERVDEMAKSLTDNAALEAATVELNNLIGGVLGPATTRKALNRWGCDAATLIKADPFLLTELRGVGFASADAVAKKAGGQPDDLNRHQAGLLHVLNEAASREGHTLLAINRAQADAARLLGQPLRREVLDACQAEDAPVHAAGPTIALSGLSGAERFVAGKLASMLDLSPRGDEEGRPGGDHLVYPPIDTAGLAADQVAAVAAFHLAPVFILCGAPGTGKTYTVARIVRSLITAGLSVELAAPTGKAAKQMSLALQAVCPRQARTIHSLLEPSVDEDGEFSFNRGPGNPLNCDVLIVDEFSMVDIRLCRSLLSAVRDTTRLLIVGDHYQLPSVGPGSVLRDLLAAGVPHHELTEIKRNAGDIVRACHAIKDGRNSAGFATDKLDLDTGRNWRHLENPDAGAIKAIIEELVRDKLPARQLDMLWDVQLVAPTNERGELSCESLNAVARGILNPAPEQHEGLPFSPGDKVVRTRNGNVDGEYLGDPGGESIDTIIDDPDVRIVNGDIGIVEAIDARRITVRLRYPDRRVELKRGDHHLKLAYCMTCHKMQGSECPVVVLPLHRSFSRMPMVSREWIYTAFSRAKQMLITVGDLGALRPIVRRVSAGERQTTLCQRLQTQEANV